MIDIGTCRGTRIRRVVTIVIMRRHGRRITHTNRFMIGIVITDRRMCGIIVVQIVVDMRGLIVAVVLAIVGIIAVGTNARVVIVTGCSPMMSVRPIDVAPVIAEGQGVNTHVIVGIEIDVADVIRRVTYENITTAVDNIEIIRFWRIGVRMRTADIAPICIAIDIFDRMWTIIVNLGNCN